MALTESRNTRVRQLFSLRMVLRAVVLGGALGAAFFVGNLLGHLPFDGERAQTQLSADAVNQTIPPQGHPAHHSGAEAGRPAGDFSEWAVATAYSSIVSPNRSESNSASSLRLRLRAVSRISSGEAQAGERITFVTEDVIEDEDGHQLPAGSRVEGIITQASVAGEVSGRLVLEIHSLHVGNQALTLRALPLAAFGGVSVPRNHAVVAAESRVPKAIKQARSPFSNPLQEVPEWVLGKAGIRSSGTVTAPSKPMPPKETREAVVPREAILEFELLTRPMMPVDGVPGQAPTLDEPQRSVPPTSPEWRPKPRPQTARG
ncbi:MAG: hypothetical protein KIT83_19290 [Bryobacterales bacterium]|nr:hypothetical protein [Bryobacterales bacterium]